MSSLWTASGGGSLRQGDQPDGPPLADLPINNTFESCPDRPIGSLRQGGRTSIDTTFTQGRGAGRSAEYVFPITKGFQTGSDAGLEALARYSQVHSVHVGAGQAPGFTVTEYYKGRIAFKSVAVTGLQATTGPHVMFAKYKGGAAHKGDFANWRVKAILAFNPIGGGDLGLALGAENIGALFMDSHAGFTLRPNLDGTVTFYAKKVEHGAITISDVCPIALNVAEWNCYEFRMLGATNDTDAQLRVIINNQEQMRYSWGDGLLPDGVLEPTVITEAGGTFWLPVAGMSTAAAPDEGSLL